MQPKKWEICVHNLFVQVVKFISPKVFPTLNSHLRPLSVQPEKEIF